MKLRRLPHRTLLKLPMKIGRSAFKHPDLWAAVLIPVLTVLYGVGNHYDWWDRLTGRMGLEASLERLMSPDGYPRSFISPSDQLFEPLLDFLSRNTTSVDISRWSAEGRKPVYITRMGGGEIRIQAPPEFPKSVVVPAEAPVIFIYDMTDGGGVKTGYAWVGSLNDVRGWISAKHERERFYVEVMLLNLLAVAVATKQLWPIIMKLASAG